MYIAAVTLLMLVLPVAFILVDALALHPATPLLDLIGKWFVFWAVGVRLFTAGLRQVLRPEATASGIFDIQDRAAWVLVRELGFSNVATGLLGMLTLFFPAWLLPAALVSGVFYASAGLIHVFQHTRNTEENIAMVSDLWIAVILAFYFFGRIGG